MSALPTDQATTIQNVIVPTIVHASIAMRGETCAE
jgi:hypothetical protein